MVRAAPFSSLIAPKVTAARRGLPSAALYVLIPEYVRTAPRRNGSSSAAGRGGSTEKLARVRPTRSSGRMHSMRHRAAFTSRTVPSTSQTYLATGLSSNNQK